MTDVIISLCSLGLAILVYLSNGRKDARVDAAREARTEAKLDSIANGVTELRLDLRTMDKKLTEHGERLSRVEGQEVESHRRLDELEAMFHRAHPPG